MNKAPEMASQSLPHSGPDRAAVQSALLDQALLETYPASDPLSIGHVS